MPSLIPDAMDRQPASGQPILRNAYGESGLHLRTRIVGILGTSCVCLTVVASAFLSWNSASDSNVHLSSAPLSIIQMNSAAEDSVKAPQETAQPSEPQPSQPTPPVQRSPAPALTPITSPTTVAATATPNAADSPAIRTPPVSPATPTPAPTSAPAQPKPTASASPPSGQARASWEADLLRHLEKFRRYPSAARARGQEGVAYIRFTMTRSGQVTQSQILQSSKVAMLDRAALETLRRAQPLPAIPANFPDTLEISLPVEFFLDQ